MSETSDRPMPSALRFTGGAGLGGRQSRAPSAEPLVCFDGAHLMREPMLSFEQEIVNGFSAIDAAASIWVRWAPRPAERAWPVLRVHVLFSLVAASVLEQADRVEAELRLRFHERTDLECFWRDVGQPPEDGAARIWRRHPTPSGAPLVLK